MADDGGAHSHLIAFPEALEAFFTRLPELKAVLGPAAAPEVDAVAEALREGLAARERGDAARAVARIADAMDRLAAVAGRAEPAEGAALRMVAAQFRRAMSRGDVATARETADTMRVRSGSV